jgi:hypothetical protein
MLLLWSSSTHHHLSDRSAHYYHNMPTFSSASLPRNAWACSGLRRPRASTILQARRASCFRRLASIRATLLVLA